MPGASDQVLNERCFHRLDAFAFVQLEAMASGKAIIASDIPELREVLAAGRNAEIVPLGDTEKWADAIEKLVSDDKTRQRYEQANLVDAEQYNWPAIAKRYAEVYQRVLSGRDGKDFNRDGGR